MTQKVMWGALVLTQSICLRFQMMTIQCPMIYTAMEHHWDESFGYFGAARDYNTGYSDDTDRKTDPYNDSNGDGLIDFKTEYNMGWAVTAAKRDLVDRFCRL